MHNQDASCCHTLTEGPAVIGKRKGSAIRALRIAGERFLLAIQSAPACVARELIQVILPMPTGQGRPPVTAGKLTKRT